MPKFNTKHVFAVILVGGKGKRLRPLSTDAKPKAFLSITKDGKTMFKKTLERIKKLIPPEDILVSANKAHAKLVKRDFPAIKKENLILEPVSRNTAPAIGLAAMALKKKFIPRQKASSVKAGMNAAGSGFAQRSFTDPVMVIVPADQYIPDEGKYLKAIKDAVRFAAENDCLMILGLRPTYPATGFGYVKIKAKTSAKAKDIYKVDKFVEKPDLSAAKRYMRDGRYFWNAGAFIFRTNSILKAIRAHAPAIYSLLMQAELSNLSRIYAKFPDISIDYAVMEHAENIYCVKGGYRWWDIGNFDSLKEILKREARDFVEKNGKVIKVL